MSEAYEYATEPLEHQREWFERTRDARVRGALWEQGTGKTKPNIDTAAWLYERGSIDGLIVVAPNGVHFNWLNDELPKHMPERLQRALLAHVWRTKAARTKTHQRGFEACLRHRGLACLFMSYDAVMTEPGRKALWRFLQRRSCLYILDEAHYIKTPKAKRTQRIVASGAYADYRRILTGTPGDSPFDLYSQLRFLDPDIWKRKHLGSFAAFKAHYAEWFTAEEAKKLLGYDPGYDRLLRYKNLEELHGTLMDLSDRVTKEDVLDLPPKLFTKLYVELTPVQRAAYDELTYELELELDSGAIVDGTMALVRLLRLQQIACGYVAPAAGEPVELIDKNNPRLEATVRFVKELPHPCIIWSRFTADVDFLCDALGEDAVRYDGKLSDLESEAAKQRFNAGEGKYFVGNPAKGSTGLTLNAAKTVVYHANSFKYIERVQSEDRAHRIGQDGAEHAQGTGVLYVDVCAPNTVDVKIIRALRDKYDIASTLTGDELRDWI